MKDINGLLHWYGMAVESYKVAGLKILMSVF
jgi:hypothetical protein